MSVESLLNTIGVQVMRHSTTQFQCMCPRCWSDHMYVNDETGAWDCKKGCGKGGPRELAQIFRPEAQDTEIKAIVAEHIGANATPRKEVERVLRWPDLRPLTDDEMATFCNRLKFKPEIVANYAPEVTLDGKLVVIKSYDPANIATPCGGIRIMLEGGPVVLSNGEAQKYPAVPGSMSSLIGLPYICRQVNLKEIVLAEGWKDALAAMHDGYVATAGILGAQAWRDSWLPIFKDRRTIVVYDRDKAGFEGSTKAIYGDRSARGLTGTASPIHDVELPYELTESHGKDLYDFVIEDAKSLRTLIDEKPGHFIVAPGTGASVPGAFSVPPAIVNDNLPDGRVDTIVEALVRTHIANDIHWKYKKGLGWVKYGDGKWDRVDEETVIFKDVSDFIASRFAPNSKGVIIKLEPRLSTIRNCISLLRVRDEVLVGDSQIVPFSDDPSLGVRHIISLQNGLLDWSGDEPVLRPHSHKLFTLCQLPFDWDPDKKESDLWDDFLTSLTGGDEELYKLCQHWFGCTLLASEGREQPFLILYGKPNSGKSVFADILSRLLGQENVSFCNIKRFTDEKYLASTYGKALNVSEECDSQEGSKINSETEEAIKHYTGSTMFCFREIYGHPFHAYPTAKLMFISNPKPFFKDLTDALWRRMRVFYCSQSVPQDKVDRQLTHKLAATELPAILRWAIAGAKEVDKNGIIKLAGHDEDMRTYKEESIPVMSFFVENTIEDERYDITKASLYAAYRQWCEDNGMVHPMNMVHFSRHLYQKYPHEPTQRSIGGVRHCCFHGVVTRSDSAYHQMEVIAENKE
jgi:P4 family phage/plasmid primase-like protien